MVCIFLGYITRFSVGLIQGLDAIMKGGQCCERYIDRKFSTFVLKGSYFR